MCLDARDTPASTWELTLFSEGLRNMKRTLAIHKFMPLWLSKRRMSDNGSGSKPLPYPSDHPAFAIESNQGGLLIPQRAFDPLKAKCFHQKSFQKHKHLLTTKPRHGFHRTMEQWSVQVRSPRYGRSPNGREMTGRQKYKILQRNKKNCFGKKKHVPQSCSFLKSFSF